jgi:hypothetical protein
MVGCQPVGQATLSAGAALLGALGGFGGAVATGWFAYASKNEELQVRRVEIAMGILRADPSKEDVALNSCLTIKSGFTSLSMVAVANVILLWQDDRGRLIMREWPSTMTFIIGSTSSGSRSSEV